MGAAHRSRIETVERNLRRDLLYSDRIARRARYGCCDLARMRSYCRDAWPLRREEFRSGGDMRVLLVLRVRNLAGPFYTRLPDVGSLRSIGDAFRKIIDDSSRLDLTDYCDGTASC